MDTHILERGHLEMPLPGEERLRLWAVQDERVRSHRCGLCRVLVAHGEAARISRQQTRPANVPEFQEQHDDPLKANATAAVLESYFEPARYG